MNTQFRISIGALISYAVLFTATVAANAGPDCPTRYTVEVITNPNGNGSQQPSPVALNGDTVVGFYYPSVTGSRKAFTWTSQTGFVPMQFPAGTLGSSAVAITEAGEIAGFYGNSSGDYGFIRAGSTTITIPTFPPQNSISVEGMNSSRQVVGYRTGDIDLLAFLWNNGVVRDISLDLTGPTSIANDINEAGLVTGYMGGAPHTTSHAFIWQQGKVVDLGIPFGEHGASGVAINNSGHVCGFSQTIDFQIPINSVTRGFLWNGQSMIEIFGLPNFPRVIPYGINDADAVVGALRARNNSGNFVAFLWTNGVTRNLNDLVPANTSILMNYATAINSEGEIVGFASMKAAPFWPVGFRLTPATQRVGDINCDGKVNVDDLLDVINGWGPCGRGQCPADVNDNRVVNVDDLIAVILDWG